MAHHVAVMYAGQIVEQARVGPLFAHPLHPYAQGLIASVPKSTGAPTERLASIEGVVPDPEHLPAGCRFAPRCPLALQECQQPQELRDVEPNHGVRCCRARAHQTTNHQSEQGGDPDPSGPPTTNHQP
jgi:oligopeptide/dipeptide ABC transporter ATP-binding protein